VRILGSLPPLCESHRPDLAMAFLAKEGLAFCVETYRAIATGLLQGGPVDAFLLETMNTWEEANCAIQAVKDLGLPVIVSMEGGIRGEDRKPRPHLAADIADKVMAAKKDGVPIEALCFNCAPPEDIDAVLSVLDAKGRRARLHAAGIHLGAYANVQARKEVHDNEGFDAKMAVNAKIRVREDLENEGYIKHLHHFVRHGVSFVGGCCGSTPVQIRMLSDSLQCTDGDVPSAPKRRRLLLCPYGTQTQRA